MNPLSRLTQRRKMTCKQVGEVLQSYLDHEVDDLMARRIARHLDQCRDCGMELSVYREIKASLHRDAPDLDPAALDRLRAFGQRLSEGDIHPSVPDEGSSGA